MKKCEHEYIYERGFHICIHCGIAEENVQHLISGFPSKPIKEKVYDKKNQNLIRILKSNDQAKRRQHKLMQRARDFLAEFDLSVNQKKLVINDLWETKPKNIKDVLINFLDIVFNRNLPITNRETWNVFKNHYMGKEIYRKYGKRRRNYYWYINKILSSLDFLKNEERCEIFKHVKRECEKIFKSRFGLDPISLIGCYCYHVIKKNFKHVKAEKRSIKYFGITGTSYRNYKEMGILK